MAINNKKKTVYSLHFGLSETETDGSFYPTFPYSETIGTHRKLDRDMSKVGQ